MPELYQSLSHSRWHCKYHVVFVPKKRRSVLYGRIRQALGPIFHALARQKECRIVEGHICVDHVHMCIEIPPKYAVSSANDILSVAGSNLQERQELYDFVVEQLGRIDRPERVGKSPAGLLSGNAHPHWLELLGFERFRRN